jgi:hypothetical protein
VPQDWIPQAKLRVVVESRGLAVEELGALLPKEALHQAQLEEWLVTACSSRSSRTGMKRASAESKRICELARELCRREKALAESVALLVLKEGAQSI